MTVIVAAAAAYEFGNVPELDLTAGRYDPDYALGAVTRRSPETYASLFFNSNQNEIWLHSHAIFGNLDTAYGANLGTPVLGLYDNNGGPVGGLFRTHNTYNLSCNGQHYTDVTGVITRNILCDVDIHLYAFGTSNICELYIDGVKVAQHTRVAAWNAPQQLRIGGPGESAISSFSELIITQGNEPTLGWRLHSKLPDPSLPGLNTFDSGYWGALANGALTDGAVTQEDGARLTGGFQPYTGPATPLGIRGIMQSGRYLKNGTLLELKGQLRINDVNYDTPTFEVDDGSRLLSFWDRNPATGNPFQVSDFAGIQGGFYTAI